MKISLENFRHFLADIIACYFSREKRSITLDDTALNNLIGKKLSTEETTIILLGLMPHIHPQALDLFFIQNKELDRPYKEFGGWKGTFHRVFLPTGGTTMFNR